MPQLGGEVDTASVPSDFVVVDKPKADLKDGPILKSSLGNY